MSRAAKKVRDIGLDVSLPTKSCDDANCPFHGKLPVRGITLRGRIVSRKMDNTAIVEREYLHYVKKYKRYERRKTRISVHVPPCLEISVGDEVTIAECRPLSKTVSFVTVAKTQVA
ncbi:MAG: 30S ribosomal protein S17 [Nitrososphaeria archaeon]|nr:30S ribosomal protein S17 [Nitrososphaeria archaeon]